MQQNAKSLPEYLTNLMAYLEEAAMEVHTACFITHRSKIKLSQNSEKQNIPKPLEIVNEAETEIETATGAKKRKTSGTRGALKGDANVSPLTIQNRFQILNNDEETPGPSSSGDTIASHTKMSKVKPVSNMETNQSEEAAASVRTNKKEPRPPPITVLGHSNVFKTNKEIKSQIKGELKVVNTREGLRYYTTSVEDHRIVKKFFESQKKEFYTHAIKSELPLKVVLKRLPIDTETDEIKTELLALGYPVRTVKQFVKTEDGNVIKYPLFPIELENTEKGRDIFNLNRLLYMVVSVDSFRPKAGMKQCFRCQRFNHTFAGCQLAPRCLICSEHHSHKECPVRIQAKDDKTKLKCANCKEVGHPASFRGCKSYIAALENYNKPKTNNKTTNPKGNKTTIGRVFTSKKVTQGLSFSSAVTNPITKSPTASAQSRLQTAVNQTRSQPSGVSANLDKLITDISPAITGLNSSMDKFMMLSKLVEICFGNHNV